MKPAFIEISKISDEIVVDENVLLKISNTNDIDEFVECVKDNLEYLKVWIPWARSENVEAESRDHVLKSMEAHKNNEWATYYIYYNDRICGAVGIHKREETGKFLEFGYWLAEDKTGLGVITKSISKLTEHVFDYTNAQGVDIGCGKYNIKSQKIPLRLGFKEVFNGERLVDAEKNQFCNGPLYRLTREDWV